MFLILVKTNDYAIIMTFSFQGTSTDIYSIPLLESCFSSNLNVSNTLSLHNLTKKIVSLTG